MQKQLALFDTSDIVPIVKPGDRVKARHKSVNAPHWKRGDVVRIDTVHPLDGSVKCWNKRTQSWGYLYPDEFVSMPPQIDLVSVQPIARDTESIAPPVDTESIAQSVELDIESIAQPVELDSVSIAQPVDSVSIAPPVDTESTPEPVEFDFVSKCVATYRPKGTARGGEYFRYSYRAGGKMKHLHISGRNTGSVLAESRVAEVMELAAAGVPSLEICDRIKSWSKKNHLETE